MRGAEGSSASVEQMEADKMALFTAERLMRETTQPNHPRSAVRQQIMEAYIIMLSAPKSKSANEKAHTMFAEIATREVRNYLLKGWTWLKEPVSVVMINRLIFRCAQ